PGTPKRWYCACERLALISSAPTWSRSASSVHATSGRPSTSTSPLSTPPMRRPSPPASIAPVMRSRSISAMTAEALVVDESREFPAWCAPRAIRLARQRHLPEAAAAGVDQQQSALQRIAEAEDQLQHFQRLHHADQPRHHAQHARLAAWRRLLRRRRLGEQAAVAGLPTGAEHRHLAAEALHRAVHIGPAQLHAGIVDQIARRKIVRPIHDDIVIGED